MVLVDTSIWIRFLAGRRPFRAQLEALLERDEVAGHELVYGELLIGDTGGRLQFLSSYQSIHQVPSVAHADVLFFVRSHKLHGRGIGWIDAHLLASAFVSDTHLWTADEHMAILAGKMGIECRPAP